MSSFRDVQRGTMPPISPVETGSNRTASRPAAGIPVRRPAWTIWLTWLALTAAGATAQASDAGDAALKQTYAAAERVLDGNLRGKVRNARVLPNWIGDSSEFWYRRDGEHGAEWVIVDAASGARRQALDPTALRRAMAEAVADPALLDGDPVVERIQPGDGGNLVTLRVGTRTLLCHGEPPRCRWADPDRGTDALWSPDGRRGLFVRDHDLWLRHADSGKEQRLTEDGEAHNAYGARPGSSYHGVADLRAGPGPVPHGAYWSPDGSRVFGIRHDERRVQPYPFVEWTPLDGSFRPKVWQPRIALMGDAEQPIQELFGIDVDSAETYRLALPAGWRAFMHPLIHWSADGRKLWGLAVTQDYRGKALFEADMAARSLRLVIEEHGATPAAFGTFLYSPPSVRILEDSGEAIWFSQADDWGRLQLRDLADGQLKRKLSAADRSVRDIIDIDVRNRLVYYTSGGGEDDDDAYHTHIHRVHLDAGEPQRLTGRDGVHSVALAPVGRLATSTPAQSGLSPDGRWLVDTWSTLSQPPVSVIRATDDGRVVATLEQADASAVFAAGWRPPTRVRLLAADGETPIWATVYFPPDLADDGKRPVIHAVYGGPQVVNAPADFMDAIATQNPVSRASLARLGFIVVTIDARGTPGRSRRFNEHSQGGHFAEPQLADHAAALEQLARRFGNLDLDRVGVYGHSFGGYVSARAILTQPELYKVAVSSAGPHSFQGFYPVDVFFGPPDYGDGSRLRAAHDDVPAPYDRLDLMPLAKNLRGKLLLVYGDLDENAFPAQTLQLVDALTRANRRYDLLALPNRDHHFFRTDAYYTQRLWDYFVEHLLGREPPRDFDLTLSPPSAAPASH